MGILSNGFTSLEVCQHLFIDHLSNRSWSGIRFMFLFQIQRSKAKENEQKSSLNQLNCITISIDMHSFWSVAFSSFTLTSSVRPTLEIWCLTRRRFGKIHSSAGDYHKEAPHHFDCKQYWWFNLHNPFHPNYHTNKSLPYHILCLFFK